MIIIDIISVIAIVIYIIIIIVTISIITIVIVIIIWFVLLLLLVALLLVLVLVIICLLLGTAARKSGTLSGRLETHKAYLYNSEVYGMSLICCVSSNLASSSVYN